MIWQVTSLCALSFPLLLQSNDLDPQCFIVVNSKHFTQGWFSFISLNQILFTTLKARRDREEQCYVKYIHIYFGSGPRGQVLLPLSTMDFCHWLQWEQEWITGLRNTPPQHCNEAGTQNCHWSVCSCSDWWKSCQLSFKKKFLSRYLSHKTK